MRWVWTRRLAMPTMNGLIQRSPAANPQHITSSAQNGRISAWGCHASKSSSLPIDHASPADRAVTRTRARPPPARCAAHAAPTMAAMLATMTPTANPTLGPPMRTKGARTSNHSGPGLLMFRPAVSDADVHVPRNGWFAVATSSARSRISPLSPIATHPRVRVRTVATTSGVIAITTAAIGTQLRVGFIDVAGPAANPSPSSRRGRRRRRARHRAATRSGTASPRPATDARRGRPPR